MDMRVRVVLCGCEGEGCAVWMRMLVEVTELDRKCGMNVIVSPSDQPSCLLLPLQ